MKQQTKQSGQGASAYSQASDERGKESVAGLYSWPYSGGDFFGYATANTDLQISTPWGIREVKQGTTLRCRCYRNIAGAPQLVIEEGLGCNVLVGTPNYWTVRSGPRGCQ
jgi:hypothetical protein